ncbi:MAG: tetraacyldisaccharide 4'-kinase [Phycisphaerales bacterium]|nr:tetraacyldisaccharide 4'-kinase [Phycisphaerales bacterium]
MLDDRPYLGAPALAPLAWAYGLAVRLRNRWYDDPRHVHRAGVPVISVGNLTTGGTGKTPFVILLVQQLRALGHRPAILTRGYGRTTSTEADEVLEFRAALPEIPVVVNADRVVGARQAVMKFAADVLVLDDGFQHRRLARDLDIVLCDALRPFGGGRLLPAGRLREPLPALRRAQLLVLTRANQQDATVIETHILPLLRRHTDALLLVAEVAPGALVARNGQRHPLETLRRQPVLGVCGVGNPTSFRAMLAEQAGQPVEVRTFADHHPYTAMDVRHLRTAAQRIAAGAVITTRKDWGKLEALWPVDAPPLYYLEAHTVLRAGSDALKVRLSAVCATQLKP